MQTLNIDLSSSSVPAGIYRVRIEDVDARPSKSGTYPYLRWLLVVTEPPYERGRVYLSTSLSPNAWWKLERIFRSLGVCAAGSGVRLVTDDETHRLLEPRVIGLEATATVEEYTWDGKRRTRACDLRGDAQGSGDES